MRYVGMWRIMSARYLTYLSMLEVCWLLRLFGACLEGFRGRARGGVVGTKGNQLGGGKLWGRTGKNFGFWV